MRIFLNLLNILGYLSLFLVVPLIVVWLLELYIILQIISIIISISAICVVVKKINLKYVGIKILLVFILTIFFSYVAYLGFGFIMQLHTRKLVNEISSIETYLLEPGDKFSNIIPKSDYENTIKFVNEKTIFSKGSYGAKVNFKNGKSITTHIVYSNPLNPIIKINNYNYMLY